MKVTLIGSGNVATVFGKKINDAGHSVLQVFSRNENHAAALAGLLNCKYTSFLNDIDQNADLYIIATADQSLQHIGDNLFLNHKLVVHTAGSVSKNVLQKVSTNYGVIYPLQSLRKEVKEFPQINLLVDGNTEDSLTLIYDFAKTIGDSVEIADDESRLKLHIAAVIVSNFSNHLYSLAENYCIAENINFNLLLPLIEETATRLRYGSPQQMQTGPAFRNDRETIQKHLEILSNHQALKQVFETLTQSIRQFYNKPE